MNILNLVDALEDELEKGKPFPIGGKVLLDRGKCLDIIRDIRLNLPDELKEAELIKEERQRILVEAQQQAETIIKEAENQIKTIIDEHEITQTAYEQSREIVENARNNAKEMRLGAKEYADSVLMELEEYLLEYVNVVRNNRSELNTDKK